jgi:hypothetical protein
MRVSHIRRPSRPAEGICRRQDGLAAGWEFCYGGRMEFMDIGIEALIPRLDRMRLLDAMFLET